MNNYKFEDIESCECIGFFDEYVYDIEVDDNTHTFIANDILVHNSCYLAFGEVLDKCNWTGTIKDFILEIYNKRLKKYIENILQEYADNNNTENYLNFELESIAKSAIWLAKKKYMQDLIWKDPDISFESLTKIKSKGFEIIQSSTPQFAREKLKELLKYIFSVEDVKISEMVKYLKKIKQQFKLANLEHISQNLSINNYKKYILNDRKEFTIEKRCPLHVRGSGYHNYLLYNSKFKNKYNLIADGEKVKIYYTTDKVCNIFSYIAGSYPYEFAPPMDYELQFEKTIIDPINRVIAAIGLQTLDRNLIYSSSLF